MEIPKVIEFNGKQYGLMGGERKYYLSKSNTNSGRKNPQGLHVAIWEFYNKRKVPVGYQIHHKDGDTFNNDINNLECLPTGKHLSWHYSKNMENPEFADKVKANLEAGSKRQAAAMLALEIAGKLDSFYRNACGGGFCYATFKVAKGSGNYSFLPDGVLVRNGEINATAHTSFPLDSLNLTVDDFGGESRITARGFG